MPVAVAQEGSLPLASAGELVRGMITLLADELGIDVVLLKGRATSFHGLAEPKVSADVDVLSTREGLASLEAALVTRGWTERPWSDPDGIFPQHSITYYHPQWPVDVDLHFRFPGCEAPVAEVLQALREDGVHVLEAGVPTLITGEAGSIVISAVHALRDSRDPRAIALLQDYVRRVKDRPIGPDVVRMATALGALASVEPFLRLAFPRDTPVDCGRVSAEWLVYSRNTQAASVRLAYLLQARGRSIPHMLWRAFWPSREALAATDLRALTLPDPQLRMMRRRRLIKAFRTAPTIVSETVAYFRESAATRAQARRGECPQVPQTPRSAESTADEEGTS